MTPTNKQDKQSIVNCYLLIVISLTVIDVGHHVVEEFLWRSHEFLAGVLVIEALEILDGVVDDRVAEHAFRTIDGTILVEFISSLFT